MNRETKIMLGVMVVIVAGLIGLFVAFGHSSTSTPASGGQLVRDNSHKLGSGKVQVVEFGDYQCPACETAYPITKQIINDYQGKITFIFRNYPLSQHANAQITAEAAEAAAAQGKFWEMHDKLYDTQNDWVNLSSPLDTLVGYAHGLGLDTTKFKQDVQNNANQSVISQDKADGDANNLQGTPTFFIDGKLASDYSYATLKGMIDTALK